MRNLVIAVQNSNSLGAVTNDTLMVVGTPEPAFVGFLAFLAILVRRKGGTKR